MLLFVWSPRVFQAGSWLLLAVGGLSSSLAFYATSTALSAVPPATQFQGWVVVVEPAEAFEEEHQVQVSAFALNHATAPTMAYGVAVCGDSPFRGYLLIGGDARLQDAELMAGRGDARELPPGDLEVDDQASGQLLNFRDVQVVEISLSGLPECLHRRIDEDFAGTGLRIEGQARAPIVSTSGGLVDGAASRWSMPLVGRLPGTGQQLGVFGMSGAVNGEFLRVSPFAALVDAGSVPLNVELADARPPTETVDRASWYDTVPLQPTVKVTNASSETALQRWNALSAIALGVFGSIFASVIFEWLRLRPDLRPRAAFDVEAVMNVEAAGGIEQPRTPAARTRLRTWGWAAVAGYAFGRFGLLRRPRRGRR
jgi:hypothetical protein